MIRRPPRSTQSRSSAASDVYKRQVLAWAAEGSVKAAYDKSVAPLLEKRCMACHDGSNPHLPNLNGYENLKKVTEKDTGTAIATLIRVSHIHLFGVTFIFFLVGLMFTHAYVRPVWFKCTVVCLLYTSDAADDLLCVDLGGRRIIK